MPRQRIFEEDAFTLVEIIIVFLIIGIMVAVAMPKVVSLVDDANRSSEEYTVGAIKEGLHMQEMDDITN